MQSIFAIVASAESGEPVLGVAIFAIAGFWFYMKMDRRDKDHELEMKKLDKDHEE